MLFNKPPNGFEKFMKEVRGKGDKKDDKEKKEVEETEEEAPAKKTKTEEKKETKKKEQEETESEEEGPKKKNKDKEEEAESENLMNKMKAILGGGSNGGGPDPKFLFAGALLGAIATTWLISKLSKPVQEKTYIEFVNDYMTKNQVKEIKIIKEHRSDVFNYRAEVECIDGSKFYITLGSVDNFLAKIDMLQREMGRQPAQFIPVKYGNDQDQKNGTL
jgi:hypothetical protein